MCWIIYHPIVIRPPSSHWAIYDLRLTLPCALSRSLTTALFRLDYVSEMPSGEHATHETAKHPLEPSQAEEGNAVLSERPRGEGDGLDGVRAVQEVKQAVLDPPGGIDGGRVAGERRLVQPRAGCDQARARRGVHNDARDDGAPEEPTPGGKGAGGDFDGGFRVAHGECLQLFPGEIRQFVS